MKESYTVATLKTIFIFNVSLGVNPKFGSKYFSIERASKPIHSEVRPQYSILLYLHCILTIFVQPKHHDSHHPIG